ncbi:hypothetical protein FBR06_05145 [Betaproteobacteria bacterium PRO4]|uniref:oligosaccharide flippase family protein n=1 Tax=Nitrosomonas sp. TaxID=42353 RepID=UPI00255FFD90|nr:hypothetical protein [Betaproteobacteria bacterium PRO4]
MLGIEGFGLVNFALSFILYFSAVMQYDFTITAVIQIAKNRDNPEEIAVGYHGYDVTHCGKCADLFSNNVVHKRFLSAFLAVRIFVCFYLCTGFVSSLVFSRHGADETERHYQYYIQGVYAGFIPTSWVSLSNSRTTIA